MSAENRKVVFFTTNPYEAIYQPILRVSNICLLHNPHPEFLAVKLDKLKTFGPHIQDIMTKAAAEYLPRIPPATAFKDQACDLIPKL